MADTERPPLDEHEERRRRLRSAIARIQAEVRELGPPDPDFDMKAFADEAWDAPKGDFSKTDLA